MMLPAVYMHYAAFFRPSSRRAPPRAANIPQFFDAVCCYAPLSCRRHACCRTRVCVEPRQRRDLRAKMPFSRRDAPPLRAARCRTRAARTLYAARHAKRPHTNRPTNSRLCTDTRCGAEAIYSIRRKRHSARVCRVAAGATALRRGTRVAHAARDIDARRTPRLQHSAR